MDRLGIAIGDPNTKVEGINIFQIFPHSTKSKEIVWTPADISRLRECNPGCKIYAHGVFSIVLGKNYSRHVFKEHLAYIMEQDLDGYVLHISPSEYNVDMAIKFIKYMMEGVKLNNKIRIYWEHIVSEYYSRYFINFARKLKNANISPQLGVCIDTCHLYISGVPLTTDIQVQNYMQPFIDLDIPLLIHLNDSELELGTMLADRHAEIGTKIWKDNTSGLKKLLSLDIDKIIELKDYKPSLEFIKDLLI